jgi:type IV secretory pathway TrbF-like protein
MKSNGKGSVKGDDAGSPWLAAQREYSDRYGSYVKQAHNWRKAAFGAIGISFVLAGGVVWQASQSKVVPYVVEVNHLGRAIAVSPAEQAAMPNQQVILATLSELIWRIRTVIPNATAMNDNIRAAYNYVDSTGQAYGYLNNYFTKKLYPWMEAHPGVVRTVQVTSVLPLAKNTYQIDWTESETGFSNGQTVPAASYKAIVTIQLSPPTTAAAILRNPLGIFVKTITWSKII